MKIMAITSGKETSFRTEDDRQRALFLMNGIISTIGSYVYIC